MAPAAAVATNDGEELARLGAVYLGDAVYAWRDVDGTVVLATSNGRSRSNTIYLEPEVLGKFDAFRLTSAARRTP